MPVKNCLLCASPDVVRILDLGFHPPADFFLKEHQLRQTEKRYPLAVALCRSCGHAMNDYIVSREERYQENDYSFNSDHSRISVQHFTDMAADLVSTTNARPGDLVVDIGSNVGTLLAAFKSQGMEIMGVDPSPNISAIAEKNGIPTVNDFFGFAAAERILGRGRAKIITTVNCFNHVEDLDSFMWALVSVLRDDGVFVIESPHLLKLYEHTQFGMIYHEHVSYVAVKPLAHFFKKFGLMLMHVEENEYVGGSIRIFVGRGEEHESVRHVIAKEEAAGIFDEKTWQSFTERMLQCKLRLLKELAEAKLNGGKIVAISAATRGNTLFNYCGIDNSLVDFATDVLPLKIGKYLPGSHIPIKSDDAIDGSVTHALITAWNLADFLKGKIQLKHPHLKFIIPNV